MQGQDRPRGTGQQDVTKTDSPTPEKGRRRSGQRMTKAQRREAMDRFIAEFEVAANVSAACRVVGIHRSTLYAWRDYYPDFAVRYHQAEKTADDALEAEAYRRAVKGVRRRKPHFWQGKVVGHEVITEYSDTLLIFLLKGRAPEKYRENVTVRQERLSPEVKELLRELAATTTD